MSKCWQGSIRQEVAACICPSRRLSNCAPSPSIRNEGVVYFAGRSLGTVVLEHFDDILACLVCSLASLHLPCCNITIYPVSRLAKISNVDPSIRHSLALIDIHRQGAGHFSHSQVHLHPGCREAACPTALRQS